MTPRVDIEFASSGPVPGADELRRWIAAALAHGNGGREAEICVRLVDSEEMTRLNRDFRGIDHPTNVLSFPSELPAELQLALLGDIAICAPVVRREAREQGKEMTAHWAHMAVHGTLHLLGYDHLTDADAEVMEALETEALASLGYPCPYSDYASPELAAP